MRGWVFVGQHPETQKWGVRLGSNRTRWPSFPPLKWRAIVGLPNGTGRPLADRGRSASSLVPHSPRSLRARR